MQLTNQNIYDIALRLAGELGTVGLNADYQERAGYLLSLLCRRYVPLENAYRKAHGQEPFAPSISVPLALSSAFPLSEDLSVPVSASLAALLVCAESPELANRLEQLAADAAETIREALPFSVASIVKRY